MIRIPLFLSALALLTGCAAVGYRQATESDTEAAYRAFLAEHDEGEEVEQARVRLEELAFQRARRGDDIAAYNRFLAEFTEGDLAQEARELRAQRRLAEAQRRGDEVALRRLVDREPETRAAREARDQLAQLEARALAEVDDVARLRAFLLAFPEAPSRAEVERRLDDLEFERARSSGQLSALRAYLEAQAEGIHRAEAEAALERLEADRVISSGAPAEMERFLRTYPTSVEEPRVRQAAAASLVALARRRLDPSAARRALELDPEGPQAQEAEQLVERDLRSTPRLTKLQALVSDLHEGLRARSPEELRSIASSDDPRDRWNALREVAFSDDPASLDLAISSAGLGDPLALLFARTALLTWADRRAEQARPLLDDWAARLRQRASNPEDLLRLGAVSEALGDPTAALRAFQRAFEAVEDRRSPLAVAAASHWALLAVERPAGEDADQALAALAEVGRARLQDLLDASAGELDAERQGSALQSIRGLEGLTRVCEAVVRASSGPDLTATGIEPAAAADGLERIIAAAEAARRRLFVRLQQVAPELFEADDDPLTRRATENRRRQLEAIRGLSSLRAPETIPALAEAASIDAGEVGRESLRAIASIGGAPARAALLELAGQRPAPHPRTLAEALRTASERATARERAALVEAAEALEAPGQEAQP